MRVCSVAGCNNQDRDIKVTLFSVTNANKSSWDAAVRSSISNQVKDLKYVCSEHFLPEDICTTYALPSDVIEEFGQKKVFKLKKGAIPSLFNQIDSKQVLSHGIEYQAPTQSFRRELFTVEAPKILKRNIDSVDSTSNNTSCKHICLVDIKKQAFFKDFLLLIDSISLPLGWISYTNNNTVVFYKPVFIIEQLVIEKQIIITNDEDTRFYIFNKMIDPKNVGLLQIQFPLNIKNVLEVINYFHCKQICQGGPMVINFPGVHCKTAVLDNKLWRHQGCSILVDTKKRCIKCDNLYRQFRRSRNKSIAITSKRIGPTLTPTRRHWLKNIFKKKKNAKQSNYRFRLTIAKLNSELAVVQDKTANLSDSALNSLFLSNRLNDSQKTIIQEIVNSSKAPKPNNRRYSENWILLCILLKIRSTSTYSFLREQEILPLPCTRTIRKYLSLVTTQCGFDEKFFLLFKKKMSMLNHQQKHGMLIFDEIFLRESIHVNSQTLTYSGLEDFGGEVKSTGLKANHGLVFLFQSLTVNFTQPIAVFTSKGPVKGTVLAQLVIKAICLLEKAGAIIDGVVSDGATTNRKLWLQLGINGEKGNITNSFQHPLESKRRIYMLSDPPHLIKNVRNRLYNKKALRESPNVNYIRWSHYVDVHSNDLKRDSNSPSRVCPKITQRHLALDNFSKMSVKLATQVFSNSMAKGIEFYRCYEKVESLENSEQTQLFTERINQLFDALNRKFPAEGIKSKSNDFDVLEKTLKWLDLWEDNVINHTIPEDEFLTKSTAEGLRVTIKSLIELSKYLLDECGFKYVLTSKMNQDRLEQFFGMSRQATGPNDHPNCPTFLQVYKMLAML